MALFYKKPTMLFFSRLFSRGSTGLHISDSAVRFVTLKGKPPHLSLKGGGGKPKGVRLLGFGMESLPEGIIRGGKIERRGALVEILSKLRKKMGTRFVHVSLPKEFVRFLYLELPKEKKYAKVLANRHMRMRKEITSLIRKKSPEYKKILFDFAVLGESAEKIKISVFLMPKNIVEEYLSVLRGAGFVPLSLQVGVEALARATVPAYERLPAQAGKVQMFVVCDKDEACLVIAKGQVPLFSAPLEPERSILADELKFYLIDWNSGQGEKIESVVLIGKDVSRQEMCKYLRTRLRENVLLAPIWENICSFEEYIPPMTRKDSPYYVEALGLALSGIDPV